MRLAGRSSSENKLSLYALSLGDLLAAIMIAGFGMYFLLTQGSLDNTATKVLVSKGGVPLSTFFLDADRRVDLKQFGVNMVLQIRDGRVRIASSDCKQQLCVRHGWIEQPREAVFCLPNHIAVELSGDGAEYDAISR